MMKNLNYYNNSIKILKYLVNNMMNQYNVYNFHVQKQLV